MLTSQILYRFGTLLRLAESGSCIRTAKSLCTVVVRILIQGEPRSNSCKETHWVSLDYLPCNPNSELHPLTSGDLEWYNFSNDCLLLCLPHR